MKHGKDKLIDFRHNTYLFSYFAAKGVEVAYTKAQTEFAEKENHMEGKKEEKVELPQEVKTSEKVREPSVTMECEIDEIPDLPKREQSKARLERRR